MRLLAVAALVATAALASAQEGKVYLDPEDSECWTCHAPGLWDPPMNPNFEVVPLASNVSIGQEFEYSAQLVNTWRAEQLDMLVTLDISEAPSIQFVGGRDPVLDQQQSGAIDVQPQPPGIGAPSTSQTYREPVQVSVPVGATDLRIRLSPADSDPQTGPDMTMRVFDGFETSKSPGDRSVSFTVDDAGKGEDEVLSIQGAANVAGHGFGNWTVQAQVTTVDAGDPTDPALDPQATEVPFTVTVDAWFNATEQRQQVVNKAGPVQSGGREIFTWQLEAVGAPQPGEAVRIIANVTTHYEHDSANDPDFENMTASAQTVVKSGGTDRIQVGTQTTVVVDPIQAAGVSLAAISEAIGYASAFLLLASVWTGGMFGKASRRQLNSVFGSARRRVAFHNFLSYGIIAAAIAHMIVFIVEVNYHWLLGFIWGGTAILAMLLLGVTGALQVPMIRRWNYATWRWIHLGLAIASIVFTLVHLALDGANFTFIQDALGYKDPLVPADQA